jgi:restriction system protein
MRRYYKRRKHKNLLANIEGIVVIGALMLSTGYIKIEKYSAIVGGIAIIIAVLLVAKMLFTYIKKQKKKWEYLNSDIRKIDGMTGVQFEEYLKVHFEKQGFKVDTTPTSNDYGADLILFKNGECIAVQVKRHKDKVSNKAIQEVVGALGYYRANKGMVVTNSFFTANAIALADANGVELWNRSKLIEVFQVKS